jgi:hypothetical protein
MRQITFTVDDVGVSGNHYIRTRIVGGASKVARGRQYKTSRAAKFQSLVYGKVVDAAHDAGWTEFADAVRVDVSLYNLLYDRDNAVKPLYDALQGVCFARDSHILDGAIRKIKDRGGPRYEITITEIDQKRYGKKLRKKDNMRPLSHADWVSAMIASLL